jgi:hypothetical protein
MMVYFQYSGGSLFLIFSLGSHVSLQYPLPGSSQDLQVPFLIHLSLSKSASGDITKSASTYVVSIFDTIVENANCSSLYLENS